MTASVHPPSGPPVRRRLELIRAMHRAGVRMLAGTDAMLPYVVPAFSLHEELGLLVKAWFSPLEALRRSTILPARFLNLSGTVGAVAEGKVADLVLLDANPLDDVASTRRIAAVVRNGRLFGRADLDALLAESARNANRRQK